MSPGMAPGPEAPGAAAPPGRTGPDGTARASSIPRRSRLRPPTTAARTLSRGWSADNRRWTWATTAVLASTLVVLVGTSGVLDGTTERTLAQVSDFYTGDLRLTPSRPGALPADWFRLNATGSVPGAADELRQAGATVSVRVEAQYVLSRRGFLDAYLNENQGVPVGLPGSEADPRKVVVPGSLVGFFADDPALGDLERHMVAGRLPRPTAANEAVEVAMAVSRLEGLLTPEERAIAGSPPELAIVDKIYFDITSAQLHPDRTVIHRQARVVGLYATGVDLLDTLTLVAPAEEVRALLGRGRDEPVANALLVQSGADAAAGVAERNRWATQSTKAFADGFVGQLIDVLVAVAWLVACLLFVLPTALIGHGLARQLASQQRELAVCTAIGVPKRTLGAALSYQTLAMAAWAVGIAAAFAILCLLVLPSVLPSVPAPLPLGFAVTPRSVVVAGLVAAVSVGVGLRIGLRSAHRLPLATALRAA